MISSLIQPGSHAAPGRFQCAPGPGPVPMQPDLNQMQALLFPCLCLSVLASNSGCSARGLLLHIRHLDECTRMMSPISPPPLLPILIDLVVTLLRPRSMPVWLRREITPVHKLTLDVPGVLRVARLLQDPDNDLVVGFKTPTMTSSSCCEVIVGRAPQQGLRRACRQPLRRTGQPQSGRQGTDPGAWKPT